MTSKTFISIFFILFLAISLTSCGIKTPVLPKSEIDLPYPTAIDYAINTEGVSIYNGSPDYSLYVERADEGFKLLTLASYKKVALINPKQVFHDKDLVDGKIYKYRFKHFYGRINTYSPAVVKTIKYYAPVRLENIDVFLKESKSEDKICVTSDYTRTVKELEVMVNSKSIGKIETGVKKCFSELPYAVSLINTTIIPYDKDGNPGTAFNKILERNTKDKNFPPQNVVTRRNNKDIIISWDKVEGATYNIYIVRNNKDIFLTNTDLDFFKYNAINNECVDFKLSTKRKNVESGKISVSACK